MNFHVLTLFPDMIIDGLNTSITGRAIKNGCLSVEAVNIRDYANNKHMKVDDYPYGGGAGLVMQAAPVCAAYDSLVQKIGKKPRVVYMTPQGYTFNQKMAQDFAKEGFAIATITKPDILIADEVLSVGDFLFQQKCEKRMKELMAGGTTVILVSHSIEQIERMCSKVAWLSHGHLKMNGDTETVCAAYKATQRGEA